MTQPGRRSGETETSFLASVPDTLPTATTANGVLDKNNRQPSYDSATLPTTPTAI